MIQDWPVSSSLQALVLCVLALIFPVDCTWAAVENGSDAINEVRVTGTRLRSAERPNWQSLDATNAGVPIESVFAQSQSVRINGNAGPGSLNDLYLRGADPNQALVLFNGVPINDATNSRGGVADLSVIDPWYIDTVNIVTGAISSVYGSQAGVGVIQLFSPMPADGTQIGLGADSYNGHYIGITQGFGKAALSIVHREHPRSVNGSFLETDSGLAQLQFESGPNQIHMVAWASRAEARGYPDDSGGAGFADYSDLERRGIDDASIFLGYTKQLARGEVDIQFSYRNKRENINTPAVAPGVRDPQGLPSLQSDNELKLGYATFYYASAVGDNRYLLGLDYFDEDANSESLVDLGFFILPAGFTQSRYTTGAFFEVDALLSEVLKLVISGRQDKNPLISKFSPSMLLDWRLGRSSSLFLGWGKGFKLPSFYALSNPLVGNADLSTETSKTLEAGYRFEEVSWSMGLTLYEYQFKNLIDFDPGPPPRLVNRNRVASKGMEIWLKTDVIDEFSSLYLGLTHMETETGSGQELLGRPRNRYSASFTRELPEFPFATDAQWVTRLEYRDSMLGSSIPTGGVTLNGYHDLSSSLMWGKSRATAFSIGLSNLLDEEYEETPGNVHKGIGIWATISHQL